MTHGRHGIMMKCWNKENNQGRITETHKDYACKMDRGFFGASPSLFPLDDMVALWYFKISMIYYPTFVIYLNLYLNREIKDKHFDNFSRFDH